LPKAKCQQHFGLIKLSGNMDFNEWQKTELSWWADRQLKIVALMSGIQVGMFGLMLLCFYINSLAF
jgi:hypothetical protein